MAFSRPFQTSKPPALSFIEKLTAFVRVRSVKLGTGVFRFRLMKKESAASNGLTAFTV